MPTHKTDNLWSKFTPKNLTECAVHVLVPVDDSVEDQAACMEQRFSSGACV